MGKPREEKTPRTYVDASSRSVLNTDKALRLLVDQITDYAIFLLNPNGEVATWNPGAERIKGFRREEIVGRHFRIFYPPQDQAAQKPEYELRVAYSAGRFEDEEWRVRKDGSRFWANVIITAIRGAEGQLLGYGKITRDLTERKQREEQLRDLSGRLLRMQDEERGRLGRELHDSIGQYMVALKMSMEGLASGERLDDGEIRKRVGDCLPLIDRAIREIRTMSYLLSPPMLEETGLPSAIRWHLEGFSKRSGIEVTCDIAEDIRLPREVELALFRIFQESLTNVHRHSQSKTAYIRFGVQQDKVILEIDDRGRGMRPEQMGSQAEALGTLGVGIRGMYERMRQLGGHLEIASGPEGTTVRAAIQLDKSSQDPQKSP